LAARCGLVCESWGSMDDFGRYLISVQERDIDLLLMEEFHISDEFVSWFCTQLGFGAVRAAGAWHSVSDAHGETDLLLRVVEDGRRIGILIENKIGAAEQHLQSERYQLRGLKDREAGKFDRYVTAICAPERYLSALSADSAYHCRVSYESIADYFEMIGDRRAAWRRDVLREAIEHGRRGYVMTINEVNTAFQQAFYLHLRSHYPQLKMVEPGNKGSKSNWIIMKGHLFPRGVQLHYKIDQSLVQLGFNGRNIDELLPRKAELPEDVMLMQSGRTASLAIAVPRVVMSEGFDAQLLAIEIALTAAVRLTDFANFLQDSTAIEAQSSSSLN